MKFIGHFIAPLTCWIAVLATVSIAVCAAPAGPWTTVQSGPHVAYSNAGAGPARAALEQVLLVQKIMAADLRVALPENTPPIRVYVLRHKQDFKEFREDASSLGFFQSGSDFDTIVVSYASAEMPRVARHEAAHRFLHRTYGQLPAWLDEGLAEMYSTAAAHGRQAWIGLPIPPHVNEIRRGRWLKSDRFLAISRDPAPEETLATLSTYYAQSWAIAHLLRCKSPYAARFAELLDRLSRNEPLDETFQSLYRQGVEQVLAEARRDAEDSGKAGVAIAFDGGPPFTAQTSALNEEDAHAAVADLYDALGLREGDREEYRTLSAQDPPSARAASDRALAALRRGRLADAEAQLRSAISSGSRNPQVYFELATLLRDREGAATEVEQLLRRTVELKPGHAEALFLLGSLLEKQGLDAQAVELWERAAQALPRKFVFREALARAYQRMGRAADAQEQARIAASCARTANERAMAAGLMDVVRQERPALKTPAPSAEPAKPLPRLEGVLVRIDCESPMRFHIQSDTGDITLTANDPSAVRMTGAPQEFKCGAQEAPLRVVATHDGSALVTLEFR